MADELSALIERLEGLNAKNWDAKPSNDDYECMHYVTILGGFIVELTAGLTNHLGAIEVSRRRAWGFLKDNVAEYGASGNDKRIIDLYNRVAERVEDYQTRLEEAGKSKDSRELRLRRLKREFLGSLGISD